MFELSKRQVVAVLALATLLLGAGAAPAAAEEGEADRLLKGAAIGAAVGAVTQAVRGHRTGVELLKGAGVGAAIGGAVGAYSDYREEESAREDAEKNAEHYRQVAVEQTAAARRAEQVAATRQARYARYDRRSARAAGFAAAPRARRGNGNGNRYCNCN